MKKIFFLLFTLTVFIQTCFGQCTTPPVCLGGEIVYNGAFSLPDPGNDDFTSDFDPACDCQNASYCLANEPRTKCGNTYWIDNLWDHTLGTSSGKYLIIDSDNEINQKVWEQEVNLVYGQTYRFSFWIMPAVSNYITSAGESYEVTIGSNVIVNSPSGSYTAGVYAWNQRCAIFTWAGTTGSHALKIIQLDYETNGDYGIDDISLKQYLSPVINLDDQKIVCAGAPIPNIGIPSTPGYTYLWDLPGPGTASTSYVPANVPGTYCLTVTSGAGCVGTECINVIHSAPINVTANTYTNCAGEVTLCPTVGTGTYTYNWGSGASSTACTTFVASNSSSGTYPVTVTNSDNCSINVNVALNVLSTPVLHTTSPAPICVGASVVLTAVGSGLYSINWTDPSGFIIPGGNPVTVTPPVGLTTYTANSTNSLTGCTGHAVSVVTVNPLPLVTATLNYQAKCTDGPIFIGKKNNITGDMFWTNGFSPTGIGAYFAPHPYIITTTLGSTTFYSFNPSANPPGVYNFIYNYTNPTTGCSAQAMGFITVPAPPTVAITGNLTICDWVNGTDLGAHVSFSPHPYTYAWTPGGETTPLIHVTSAGTYSVTVTNTVTQCSTTATVSVNFISNWHQQTHTSTANETGNGIVIDENANVYVVGTFRKTTWLNGGGNPDLQINSLLGTTFPNTYVAKYDECGDLLWVANTTNATNCEGSTITYDRINDMIYIGGTFNGNSTFNSSQSLGSLCSTAFSQSIGSPEVRGYIAQYDANTGCLYFVQALDFGNETKLNSLTINESNGNLFAGGSSLAPGFITEKKSFVRKYIPTTTLGTSNSLGPIVWAITDAITTPDAYSVINDLDYHEETNRIFMIGDLFKGVILFDGSSSSMVYSTSIITDAFIAVYNDLPVPTMQFHKAGGAVSGNYMTGAGISVDATTGRIYFTGSYSGSHSNPFGLFSFGAIPLNGFGQNRAYMMQLNLSGTISAWSHSTTLNSPSGSSFGRDVSAHNHRVLYLGEFSLAHLKASGHSGWNDYVGGMGTISSPTKHVSVIGYTEAGVATDVNVTRSQTGTSMDVHSGIAIETNREGYSFVTGQFSKYMGYQDGAPASGPLVSSGQANAYVMRVDETNIHFRNADIETTTENNLVTGRDINSVISFIVFPNPTNGLTTIAIENFDVTNTNYKLVLYNSVGKLMQQINITGNKTDVDLSNYENGIYLLSFSDGVTTSVVRISKTN